jgi:hypothetical protein
LGTWKALTSSTIGRKGILPLAVFLALLFGVSSQRAAADPTCPDGYACFWTQTSYSGDKRLVGAEFGGSGWHNFVNTHRAVKNKFTNRRVLIATGAGGAGAVRCLNPGQILADTGGTASFRVTEANAPCFAPGEGGEAPDAEKVNHWGYRRISKRDPEGPVKVRLGGGYVGQVRFIDNLIAISKRFKNAKGKPRFRLYRVSGALSVRLKDGYELRIAQCRTKVPGGRLVPLTDGTRAFYPQPADEAPETAGDVNVGLNLGPISVSAPVQALDLYSGSDPPAIGWGEEIRSSKHSWVWLWGFAGPNGELLPFLGHWVTGADGIDYKVVCDVGVTGYGAEGGATIRMKKHVRI